MKALKYLAVPAVLLAAAPASAANNLDFNGEIVPTCAISNIQNGTLALSSDNLQLGSTQSGGAAASFSVTSFGAAPEVDFDVPSLVAAPTGFSASHSDEIAFTSTGGANSSWTDGAVAYQMTALNDDFSVDGRVSLSSGAFTAGNYTLRTVVTCQYPD